jgi:hypothetical protein
VDDGYLIGAASAASLVTGSGLSAGKPGDTRNAGKLAALGVTVPAGAAQDAAGQMAGGYTAALARSLPDSQQAGVTSAEAGAALAAVLAGGDLAASLVLEQVCIASAAGARDVYGQHGVTEVDVLNGPNPCPVCAGLAASNPHAPGLVPVHLRCECCEVPAQPPP